jgi:SAM-dependent methyltransferase
MTGAADEWFADDALWEVLYPYIFPEATRLRAVQEVDAISALVAYQGGEVLDLCCGPGRHSIAFAKRGSAVTGVDRSAFLLGRARRYAEVEGVDVRWIQQDVRDFVAPGRFAPALNLFTSFGYFDEPADNRRVLENVRDSLAAGGVFVLDIMGKEVLARIFQPSGIEEFSDGTLLVSRRSVIDSWRKIENEWLVVRNGSVRSFRFRHWLYSAGELDVLLSDAGFERIEFFGGLDGASYGVGAAHLVATAYKAA